MSGLSFELEGFGACTVSPGPGMLASSSSFCCLHAWDLCLELEGLGSDALKQYTITGW